MRNLYLGTFYTRKQNQTLGVLTVSLFEFPDHPPTLTRMKQRSISKYIMDQVWASIALGEKQVKFNGYGIRFTNYIWKLGI